MPRRTSRRSRSASFKKAVCRHTRSELGIGPEHFDREGQHDREKPEGRAVRAREYGNPDSFPGTETVGSGHPNTRDIHASHVSTQVRGKRSLPEDARSMKGQAARWSWLSSFLQASLNGCSGSTRFRSVLTRLWRVRSRARTCCWNSPLHPEAEHFPRERVDHATRQHFPSG
jgi:hypothetical protein